MDKLPGKNTNDKSDRKSPFQAVLSMLGVSVSSPPPERTVVESSTSRRYHIKISDSDKTESGEIKIFRGLDEERLKKLEMEKRIEARKAELATIDSIIKADKTYRECYTMQRDKIVEEIHKDQKELKALLEAS